ncbi:hypothetical protein CYMTET_7001 [Cymbomonas tetramitiformis]|uniref:Uncharacterized protein n=1 Tax=Cymbomonas tetramitiformis TaxID=36881 RepID=A0AAE0GXT7_9CHLO|nr:hypothetical protein CYMTET_7001 [Cymbomonas tetramitiformis]
MAKLKSLFSWACIVFGMFVLTFALLHWRKLAQTEISIARRSSKQFENMYRGALEEAAEWRLKYDTERRKSSELALTMKDLERTNDMLVRRADQEQSTSATLKSSSEQLELDLASARSAVEEEVKARADMWGDLQKATSELEKERAAKDEMQQQLDDLEKSNAKMEGRIRDEAAAALRKGADEQEDLEVGEDYSARMDAE